MSGIIERFVKPEAPGIIYPLFRVVVALLFFMHGTQKLLGLFGGAGGSGMAASTGGLFWTAGLIEVVVGVVVILGLFTRLAAVLAVIEMAAALVIIHLPKGLNPLLNGGELALLFFVAFLLIAKYGAGRWSLEQKIFGREVF